MTLTYDTTIVNQPRGPVMPGHRLVDQAAPQRLADGAAPRRALAEWGGGTLPDAPGLDATEAWKSLEFIG